jgi:mRNA interferase RelE/StbE
MNKYSLDFDKKASKDLLSLDKSVRNFRLRLRTYRIIYEKQNGKLIILVLRVSHRKDVYK